MRKSSLLFMLIMMLVQASFVTVRAVKAYPFPVSVKQPDGTELKVRLHGDEFRHFQTTEDGYLIKQNVKGFYSYATVDANGNILESDVVAKNANKRSVADIQFLRNVDKGTMVQTVTKAAQKSRMYATGAKPRRAYPLMGSPKALVILANFKDVSFKVASPQASFQNLVTQPGYSANGGTGSAKDYFMSSTYGKFAPDFVVVGPVTLPQTLAYYGTNDANGSDQHADQMIADACAAADAAGLDFTQFDTDNDGYVDNVFVYYAGYNEAENGPANTIWPHRWSLTDAGFTGTRKFDGKTVNDYSCTSELKGTTGTNMCGVGTFCHEFGHVLGLPDFYDTSGSSTYIPTVETWDIMDYGPYLNNGCTPPSYSAYERFFLGFLTPEQISQPANITLNPLYLGTTQPANTTGQCYLLSASTHNLNGAAPSPAEFFLVEYRKHTGWDAYLGQNIDANGNFTTVPADGVCIWHIDYLQSAWDANSPNNYTGGSQSASSHMRVYLQPLSGQTTTPGSIFTSGSFTPTSWSGTNINRAITGITISADNATFKFMGGESVFGTFSALPASDVQSTGFTANWSAATGATKYLLNLYKKSAGTGTTTVTDGFSSAPSVSTGWTTNAVSSYTTSGNYGAASPSMKLDGTGKYIQTPLYVSSVSSFSFWYKGNSTSGSSLLIEGSKDGSTWATVENITTIPTTGTTKTIAIDPTLGYKTLRATYTKSAGNIAFDDASVTYGQGGTKTSVLTDFEVASGTSYSVSALEANTTYYYTVKAANATQSSSESNEVEVSLALGIHELNSNKVAIRADKGSVNLISSTNEVVRIFDPMGRLVKEQSVQAGATKIALPANQIYIVRVAGYSAKVVVR